MSEYIVYESETSEVTDYLGVKHSVSHIKKLKEIVLCRDCRFADWDITAWWCTRDKHYPFEIGELIGYGERSYLDVFCAWGERKEP